MGTYAGFRHKTEAHTGSHQVQGGLGGVDGADNVFFRGGTAGPVTEAAADIVVKDHLGLLGKLLGQQKFSLCQRVVFGKGGKEIPRLKEEDTDFVIAPIDEQGRGDDARHKYEWFNAIWEGKPEICWSNFANHAGPLTETILLGNLAIWAAPKAGVKGEKIEWDAKNLKITNLDQLKTPGVADLVKPTYQNGYDKIDELF